MSKFAIAGLPGSGKTTFLAALYYILEESSEEIRLRLRRLPDSAEYLQRISTEWAAFRAPGRSKTDLFENVLLEVVDTEGREFDISFPDLSGEEFDSQWESRTTSEDYAQLVRTMDGLVLFIGSNVKKPITIEEMQGIVPEYVEGVAPHTGNYRADKAPHGVKLVEMLQFVQILSEFREIRVAVVVSAWDNVRYVDEAYKKSRTPHQWLVDEIPLLYQYLSNSDSVIYDVFGVSAQGMDYVRDKDETASYFDGASRIMVQHGESRTHDLAEPILWLIGEKLE